MDSRLVGNVKKQMVYLLIDRENDVNELVDFTDSKYQGLPHRKAMPTIAHSMLPYSDKYGEKLNWTPRFPKLHNDNERHDAPHIKRSWGRFQESDVGGFDGSELLTEYDAHEQEINMKMAALPETFGWLSVGSGKLDLRKYTRQALRLLIAGSNPGAVSHVVSDMLVSDFKNDALPFDVPMPNAGKGRSRNGQWTTGQQTVKHRYDVYVSKLEDMGEKIVTMAMKQGANRLPDS